MVYNQRWSPGILVPPPAAPNPPNNPNSENSLGVAPMLKKDNGNFDIGQLLADGSYNYDGKHIVNVTAMTKEQLDQAVKELNYVMKRSLVESAGVALMLRIAKGVETPNEFLNGCWDEPFLNMSETPIFDHFLGEDSLTLAWILDELDSWLDGLRDKRWANEVLRDQIVKLGGKDIPPPIPESPVPTGLDKVKGKLADIEQHLVPEPGTPETKEDLPDVFPEPIPERPTIPTVDPVDVLTIIQFLGELRNDYLPKLLAYEEAKQFNIGWGLEMIRVCLLDLSRAKAPGTQEDAFKANLKGLGDVVFELESKGVFHD